MSHGVSHLPAGWQANRSPGSGPLSKKCQTGSVIETLKRTRSPQRQLLPLETTCTTLPHLYKQPGFV